MAAIFGQFPANFRFSGALLRALQYSESAAVPWERLSTVSAMQYSESLAEQWALRALQFYYSSDSIPLWCSHALYTSGILLYVPNINVLGIWCFLAKIFAKIISCICVSFGFPWFHWKSKLNCDGIREIQR